MFSFLTKLFGEDNEKEKEHDPFDQSILNLEVLNVSGSGTPSIKPADLIRHERVQQQIKEGAERTDMGK